MTVQDKIDTKFLKDTVADVVVKACSACAVARPEDPVGFVAGWLDQFVANDAILKKRTVELTERAAVEAEKEEVRHPKTRARVDTVTHASRRRSCPSRGTALIVASSSSPASRDARPDLGSLRLSLPRARANLSPRKKALLKPSALRDSFSDFLPGSRISIPRVCRSGSLLRPRW